MRIQESGALGILTFNSFEDETNMTVVPHVQSGITFNSFEDET